MIVGFRTNMVHGMHIYGLRCMELRGVQEDRKHELSRHYPFDLLVFRAQIVT